MAADVKLHPAEEVLLDYGTGAADLPARVLMSAHLHHCERCRADVESVRAAGGRYLRQLEVSSSPNAGTTAVAPPAALWEKLRASIAAEPSPIEQRAGLAAAGLPLPPRAWVELGLRRPVEWQKLPFSPGVRIAGIGRDAATGATLVALKGPREATFPEHLHVRTEMGVVLEGGYDDHQGEYRQGDFFTNPAGTAHRAWTDLDEGCIAVLRLEAPNRFRGWRRWILG
jgi:putative transcriptional regulator